MPYKILLNGHPVEKNIPDKDEAMQKAISLTNDVNTIVVELMETGATIQKWHRGVISK